MLSKIRILFEIAFRNLFASKINIIIGAIVFMGTVLVVVGGAMLDSVDSAMARSIRGSVAGDIQVYSAKSKDKLALFGDMSGGDPDLSPINDFSRIEKALLEVPNVKSVTPMGIAGALVTSGNTVDLTLADLRDVVRRETQQGATAETKAQKDSLKSHVKQIVTVLRQDMQKRSTLGKVSVEDQEAMENTAPAATDEFWADFDKHPEDTLEYLENKVAPVVADGDLMFLRYMGTNLDEFQKAFDRMEIVDGAPVPKGQSGYLFSKFMYEDQLKLKTARRLDLLKEGIESGKTIAADPTLQRYVKENRTQLREIKLQLDPLKTKKAIAALQQTLASKADTLDTLLDSFFDTNDANFSTRYDTFYASLAPLLQLYRLRIGDILTIKAFTRSGYVQSVNVKVYGTFRFKGLEKSQLSGAVNLMDLMSFRQLYGYLTPDKLKEIDAIKKEAGAKVVNRDSAEDELFGDNSRQVVAEATPGLIDDAAKLKGSVTDAIKREDLLRRVYSREELNSGLVLNAAVQLKDPTQMKETMAAINALSKKDNLELQAVSWQDAAGLIGQFVMFAKIALLIAVSIIFIVILAIINNAVMMATMQRIREIGTLRAIGSQRDFIMLMVLCETLMLGTVFGGAGLLAGSGFIGWLHSRGIAAMSDEMYFFFSGPKLFPMVSVANLILAFAIVMIVSIISTFYPAIIAMRVSPVRAMSAEE